ncbi:hypothetical protein D3C85_573840 [compost metagenome]
MQARCGAAEAACLFARIACFPRAARFIQQHARCQQRFPPLRITGMHGRHIGRFQRIRQDAHAHALFRQVGKGLRARFAGHEIRRHQVHFLFRHAQQVLKVFRHARAGPGLVQHLGRVVADHARPGPFEGQGAFHHLLDEGRGAQRLHVFLGRLGVVDAVRFGGDGGRVAFDWAGQQQSGRVGRGTVPVAVEIVRDVIDDGADGQHVQVGEQHVAGRAKIFVAHIAPANDGGLVIGRERFVVHAPVEARKIRGKGERARRAGNKGIEQADFQILLLAQHGQGLVQARRVVVVEQQAHPHAPFGRLAQGIEQQGARDVLVPDVVLHVQAALRRGGQQGARGKRVAPVDQRIDAGHARMLRHHGRNGRGQLGVLCVGDDGGGGAAFQRGQ